MEDPEIIEFPVELFDVIDVEDAGDPSDGCWEAVLVWVMNVGVV